MRFTGLIWGEMNALFSSGLVDYMSDLWNIIDLISNSFYVTWIGLRITSWYLVQVSSSQQFESVFTSEFYNFDFLFSLERIRIGS